jgi:hypothetical protein
MNQTEIVVEMGRMDAVWSEASDSSHAVREKLTNDLAAEAAELKTASTC